MSSAPAIGLKRKAEELIRTDPKISRGEPEPPKETVVLPCQYTLEVLFKMSLENDKPIVTDYWLPSLEKDTPIFIGIAQNGEKYLVKNKDEYTSNILKGGRSKTDLVFITENSIYVTGSKIPTKELKESDEPDFDE